MASTYLLVMGFHKLEALKALVGFLYSCSLDWDYLSYCTIVFSCSIEVLSYMLWMESIKRLSLWESESGFYMS